MVKEKTEEKKDAEMAMSDSETKTYELGYLLVPTITEEKLGGEASKVMDVLEKDGNIVSSENPKEQVLAYTMNKVIAGKKQTFNDAYFGSIIFGAESDAIEVIKKELDKNDNILRFMIIGRTKESLIAPQKRVATAPIDRAKEASSTIKNKEVKKEVDEKEIDKEIEELVIEE
ncbi:30S ribosomal protein S6 [Patescibacteria group bacterium]